MPVLHIDFETRSDLDLPKVGIHTYVTSPNTDILCMGWAFDDDDPEIWLPGMNIPPRIHDHVRSHGDTWAHNAQFEYEVWNKIGGRYFLPGLERKQLTCTMAMAYAMAIPGGLDKCAAVLGITERKDEEGARIMRQLCQPRTIKDGVPIWWDKQEFREKYEKLYEYCKQDLRVEREAAKRMVRLSPYEKNVWVLDQKINARGIAVDVDAAYGISLLVEQEKERLNGELEKLTRGEITTSNQTARIVKYLGDRGVKTESIDKAAVLGLMDTNLPEDCKRLLEIRQLASKASTAKLSPMIGSIGPDLRLRGSFQYSGANTRRWAGRRVQLHNLPRPRLEPAEIDAILTQVSHEKLNLEAFHLFYGQPIQVASDLLRGMFVASPGHDFIGADFSAIEARVLAWLAGQESKLEIFRRGEDPYLAAASDIFGKPIPTIIKTERAVGKVAELALGYGGGVGAFQAMAKGYNVKMAPAFEALAKRCSQEELHKITEKFEDSKYKDVLSFAEFAASDLTKMFWRDKNQSIVSYWHELENAAIEAVQRPGQISKVGAVAYVMRGSFLLCRLPSGGVLFYPFPEIQMVRTPWGQKKAALTYKFEDSQSKKWIRGSTYGGSLAENVTQAVSRDLLADAMLRLDAAEFDIVLHVHDEVVCESSDPTDASLEVMVDIMEQLPPWAYGLPIEAAGFCARRYQK